MINCLVWCDPAQTRFKDGKRMSCMMMDGGMVGGGMMITMGLFWLLTVMVLVLSVIALVKYIRSDSGK